MPGLDEFRVARDKFEPAQTNFLAFPCNACLHRDIDSDSEPCRTCDHNLGSITDAVDLVLSQRQLIDECDRCGEPEARCQCDDWGGS